MKLITLNQVAPWTDDFFFLNRGTDDTLVICNPQDSICRAPVFLRSKKTPEEHIHLVQKHQIKKAMVVAEDISFLRQCPSLEDLTIRPSFNAHNFDFSPLYDMPNLRRLVCETCYGPDEDRISHVDYSCLLGLREVVVSGKGHDNVSRIGGLKSLVFQSGQPFNKTLVGAFKGEEMEELTLISSPIYSLEGLGQASNLRRLELAYNRKLVDISELAKVKNTLIELDIENCGRIKDFSVLAELTNLERLRMSGSNVLPDLSFIPNMPKLQEFYFFMNVENGDLSMCLPVPYVAIQNRKHYSHKDSDFSKGR